MPLLIRFAWLLCFALAGVSPSALVARNPGAAAERPNIVFIFADDWGWGDLSLLGHPWIKTPHLDRLAAESSQLPDYHVAPTCSPTRAALPTGHWTDRTGVWHTVNGRSMLRENEVTLGQRLKDRGSATGIFGNWHRGEGPRIRGRPPRAVLRPLARRRLEA